MKVKRVVCPLCGGEMVRSSIGDCLGVSLGCLLLLIAAAVSIAAFPVGLIIGIPVFVVALFCGGKRVWRCKQCRHVLPRA